MGADSGIRVYAGALGRIAIFLSVVMPLWFLALIYLSAFFMKYSAEWSYERSLHFMASAYTGGAIVMPADPPQRDVTKVYASLLGASGVGMFAFMVAILLNSGVTHPIISSFGLGKVHSTQIRGFLGVSIFTIAWLTAFTFLFAWIMHEAEGWTWFTSFKTMASVELGGGIVFREMGQPHTTWGTFLFIVVGCWAIGVAAIIVALSAECFSDHVKAELDERAERAGVAARSRIQTIRNFIVYCMVVLPCALLLACLLVAVCMNFLTPWDFQTSFWVAVPAVTGGAATLITNAEPRLSWPGACVLFYAATIGYLLMSMMIGVGASMIGPIIADLPFFGDRKTIGHSAFALLLICFVAIPGFVYLFAVPMGFVLSQAQGWNFSDGFWWCVAVQCGGGMALTGASPSNTGARWIGMVATAWSIGISIVCIGLSAAPVTEPLMEAVGMDVRDEVKALLKRPKHMDGIISKVYGTSSDAEERGAADEVSSRR